MRDLTELEIPSSPITPPIGRASSPGGTVGTPVGSHSPPISPLGLSEPLQLESSVTFNSFSESRKHPAEDLSQLIEHLAREKRFKPNKKKALSQFSVKTENEKAVILFSEFVELKGLFSRLAPPDVVYNIPKTLKTSIDSLAATTLLDPLLGGYLATSMKIVEVCYFFTMCLALSDSCQRTDLTKSSGFTQEIKENKSSWNTVKAQIRGRLMDFRCSIKGALLDSVYETLSKADIEANKPRTPLDKPLNILETAESVASIHKGTHVHVDVAFCVCIAFLRNILVVRKPADYWKGVDDALATIRKNHNNPRKLSAYFAIVLEEDMKEFGQATI